MKIIIHGELPKENKTVIKVIKAAILESVNNAVHHADSTGASNPEIFRTLNIAVGLSKIISSVSEQDRV